MPNKKLLISMSVIFGLFVGCGEKKLSEYERLKQDILQANINSCVSGGLYSLEFCKCAMQIAYDSLEKDGEPYYKTLMNPPKGDMQKIAEYMKAEGAISARYRLIYNAGLHNKKCKGV